MAAVLGNMRNFDNLGPKSLFQDPKWPLFNQICAIFWFNRQSPLPYLKWPTIQQICISLFFFIQNGCQIIESGEN